MIERLLMKVQIQRPGLRSERVRDWIKIEEESAFYDPTLATKHYEKLLENLSGPCKEKVDDFNEIFRQLQK